MWHIFSWWLFNLVASFWWTIGSFFVSLFTPNMTCYSVIYISLSVFVIGFLFTLNSYLKKRKEINNFLKKQKENRKKEIQIYPVIPKQELYQGVFKHNISCENSNSFAFHALLFAKQSEEILGK